MNGETGDEMNGTQVALGLNVLTAEREKEPKTVCNASYEKDCI